METLIATIAYTTAGYDVEVSTYVRLIIDTLQNAPGLVSLRFYRGQGFSPYHLFFTTWEDEESWQKAQEHHNPGELLLSSASGLLAAPPEQWHMHYIWGHHRPAVQSNLAAAHIATVPPDRTVTCQQEWLHALRQQSLLSLLGFSFLACGDRADSSPRKDQATPPSETDEGETIRIHKSFFINLFSWNSEVDKRAFYASSHYQALDQLIRKLGTMRILQLEFL
ncbi:MAG TPA: hypothetical protein VH593_33350 [Ktedonobacteraceae bacterium]